MKYIVRSLRYAKNHFWELYYFCIYAIRAKLHLFKYKSNKIALIRLDHIGDCIMFIDAAKEICRTYKEQEVTIICRAISRPVLESLGCFAKIISFDPTNMNRKAYKNLFSELRQECYDLFLQPIMSKHFVVDIVAAAIKCNRRISIAPCDDNIRPELIKISRFLYESWIPCPDRHVSEFDIYGAFVRGTCNPDYKTALPSLAYGPQNFVSGEYYVLYPGGSLTQKFWPAEFFAKIAGYIFKKTGMVGVICGTPSEAFVAEKLIAHLDNAPCINLIGKTSIVEVIDIIGNSKLVVSNDTSGVHIAAATNTPSVAIVGGWHFPRFLPYHIEDKRISDCLPLVAYTKMSCFYCDFKIENANKDCWKKIQTGGAFECIERVTYEQVKNLVREALEGSDLVG